MKIAIASDHGGFSLKEELKSFLKKKKIKVVDFGCFSPNRCDYPLFVKEVAKRVSKGELKRGILICKSGIGNSIVANRFPKVRAALCHNVKSARLSRQHNDSNILVLGSLFVNFPLAKRIVNVWLKTEFEKGRHLKRLKQIEEIENKIRS